MLMSVKCIIELTKVVTFSTLYISNSVAYIDTTDATNHTDYNT